MERPYWPDEAEQALCRQFLTELRHQGYGMCYLLGVYRGRGLSLAEAEQLIRTTFAPVAQPIREPLTPEKE